MNWFLDNDFKLIIDFIVFSSMEVIRLGGHFTEFLIFSERKLNETENFKTVFMSHKSYFISQNNLYEKCSNFKISQSTELQSKCFLIKWNVVFKFFRKINHYSIQKSTRSPVSVSYPFKIKCSVI